MNIYNELIEPSLLKVCTSHFSFDNISKCIMFDMDGTLITTKGKHTFAKDENDWKLLFNYTKDKLISLHKDGYTIIIITNQAGVGTSKKKNHQVALDKVTGIITNVLECLELPICAFAALDKDQYRKPNSTIFELYIYPHINKNTIEYIGYVGDAAGRSHTKDHSDVDRVFLENIQLFMQYKIAGLYHDKLPIIEFKTETEFYDDMTNTDSFTYTSYHPQISNSDHNTSTIDRLYKDINGKNKPFAIIMVGMPASGKSYWANHIADTFENTIIINQDNLNTKSKCIGKFKQCIRVKYNVIVDNTNSSVKTRYEYLSLCDSKEYETYIVEISHENIDLIKHLNIFRERKTGNKRIPRVAYNMFKKYYDPPTEYETSNIYYLQPFNGNNADGLDKLYFIQKSHD